MKLKRLIKSSNRPVILGSSLGVGRYEKQQQISKKAEIICKAKRLIESINLKKVTSQNSSFRKLQ